MKKVFYSIFLCALAFSPSMNAQKSSADDEPVLASSSSIKSQKNGSDEQAALRKVIESETRSYFEGSYDKWAATWAHDADCLVIFTGPTGTTRYMGWDKVAEAYKAQMKDMKPIDEDNYAINYKKYDYDYKIDGNLAVVTFKEGRGTEEIRVMQKQNGGWKIKNLLVFSSPDYNINNTYNALKNLSGKWKVDASSFTSSEKGWQIKSGSMEIRETAYGIELNSEWGNMNGDVLYINSEKEQFIKDNNRGELRYFDVTKNNNGYVSTNTGSASTESNGNIVVKIMNPDNPGAVSYDNVYSSKSADVLHLDGHAYDRTGKVTTTWSLDLKRAL